MLAVLRALVVGAIAAILAFIAAYWIAMAFTPEYPPDRKPMVLGQALIAFTAAFFVGPIATVVYWRWRVRRRRRELDDIASGRSTSIR